MKIVSATMNHATFGRTIEVNILGDQKVCNFDCVYCSLGPSQFRLSRLKQDVVFPSLEEISMAIGSVFSLAAQEDTTIDTILVSGNGEPTLHPFFPQIAKLLVERRAELLSLGTAPGGTRTRIVVLTNGDRLDDRDVVDALNLLDETVVKVDAGTEKAFKKINRPISRSTLEKVLQGSRALEHLSVQTIITGGDVSLLQTTHLEEWMEVIAMLTPKRVYLQLAESPCADPKLQLATEDDLHRISHWLERKLKIKALIEFGYVA